MAPYYQPVVDLITTRPSHNESLELVLELCKAVEAEDGPKIAMATPRVVANVNPVSSPPVLIPEEIFYETMARLLLMGEHQNLQLLLAWYRPTRAGSPFTNKERIAANWAGIFEFVTLPPANLTEKELDQQLSRIITALRCVLPAHASAVAEASPVRIPDPASSEPPSGSFGSVTYGRPSLKAVFDNGLRKLFLAWMGIHQQFLDNAWEHLGAGGKSRGEKLLALRNRWRRAIMMTVGSPQLRKSPLLAQLEVELTKIKYVRSPKHRYLDAFPPHDVRQFWFTSYDREPQDEPSGKLIRLDDLFRYRSKQLNFLLDEYGEYYPPDEKPRKPSAVRKERQRKAAYTGRRKLIDEMEKQKASLRLKSEDDLISFGCAFFQAHLGTKAAQSSPVVRLEVWNTLLDFLSLHLKTHTTHTEFNLDEKPSYFDRLFPRAINGGVLHDCGVYAVRLAYVFLTLAHCVQAASENVRPPRISFIMLPLHVGLIIEIDGFPPIVVHNNILFRMTEEQLKTARKEWDASPEKNDPKDADSLNQKFLEDLAAQMFLRDVDLPLKRVAVAPVSVPPRKQQIWKAYRVLVIKIVGGLLSRKIEHPSRPEYQFDLEFLRATTNDKHWHDTKVVPFWNEGCHGLWKRNKESLKRFPHKKEKFAKALEGLIKPVEESYEKEIRPMKEELSRVFRANPDLVGPQAQRITTSNRLKQFATSLGPVGVVRAYVAVVRNTKGPVPEPPFATEADLLSRHGD